MALWGLRDSVTKSHREQWGGYQSVAWHFYPKHCARFFYTKQCHQMSHEGGRGPKIRQKGVTWIAPYLKSLTFYTYNATIDLKHRACLFLATNSQKNEEKNIEALKRNRFTFYDFPNVKKTQNLVPKFAIFQAKFVRFSYISDAFMKQVYVHNVAGIWTEPW